MLDQGFATVDEKKREAIAREAAAIALKDQAVIPSHHQIAIWGMKANISYVARTDEYTFAHHMK